MAQRQWRSDDTDQWVYGFGSGVDGNLTISADTTDAPIDSACSGTSGTTSLTATNASFAAGQLVMIHQTRGTGAGNWELNRISSYTAGTITLTHNLMNTYTNSGSSVAQVVVLKQYQNVTINSGNTLTAKAWNGTVGGILAFFANNTLTYSGTSTCSDKGFSKGNGGAGSTNNTYDANGLFGENINAAAGNYGNNSANGNGGGGGSYNASVNYGGGGGGGGNGATGEQGTTSGGAGGLGGATAGTENLTTMVLGGGGGGGSGGGNPGGPGFAGGNGGGIIFIAAQNIVITGAITANGSQGSGSGHPGYDEGAGGGGAGGSILLKCQTATLGSNLLTASGGPRATKNGGQYGGAGGVGRIHLDYSGSYTGTTNPTLDATLDPFIIPVSSRNARFYFM